MKDAPEIGAVENAALAESTRKIRGILTPDRNDRPQYREKIN